MTATVHSFRPSVLQSDILADIMSEQRERFSRVSKDIHDLLTERDVKRDGKALDEQRAIVTAYEKLLAPKWKELEDIQKLSI